MNIFSQYLGLNLKIRANKNTIQLFKKYNLESLFTFIFGFDGDTKNTFDETYKFIQSNHIDPHVPQILTPYPGTEIYNEFIHVITTKCKRKNR